VPGESAGAECQAIKDSCEDITQGETTCNYPGVAVSVSTGTPLSCVWIKDAEKQGGGSCEEKVCFIFFLLKKERGREMGGGGGGGEKKCKGWEK
jgi:hypothetical protein